jgi:hypothetical protein
VTLPEYHLDDPAVRSLSRDELAALQDERLRTLVAYARATSGFWRGKLDAAGELRGVADLPALEATTRAELDAEQAANPPFGDYTCSARETWMGMFTTSGTAFGHRHAGGGQPGARGPRCRAASTSCAPASAGLAGAAALDVLANFFPSAAGARTCRRRSRWSPRPTTSMSRPGCGGASSTSAG